jgi:hypothetical protein
MVTQFIDRLTPTVQSFSTRNSRASQLGPQERKVLSVQALSRGESISRLSRQHGVSRKFIYQQASKASDALDEAFAPSIKEEKVLFYLPVTKSWIRQFVLALVFLCHSSFRGVIEILRDVFDYQGISLGTVHNILQEAVPKAQTINQAQDLSSIRVPALDEVFQAGNPVLAGADVRSTYCFLLALEASRDETAWGVHLLDAQDQGLQPDYSIADFGGGLRAGQAAAWGDTPCHGDVFHAERELGNLATFLERRAAGCQTVLEKLQRKMERAKKRSKGNTLSKRLASARKEAERMLPLARNVRTLADWMQKDILSLAGPSLIDRRALYDYVVAELRSMEHLYSYRIRPVRTLLENQRDNLLAFVGVLDQKLADIAKRFHISVALVHEICTLQNLDKKQNVYWQQEQRLRQKLRGRFHEIQEAVLQAMADTPRASSIIENLNSRLRDYFFLRHHLSQDYLDLLRFFINHHRFLRSDRPERIGKSPAELLNGRTVPHWLELLGFKRFQRN